MESENIEKNNNEVKVKKRYRLKKSAIVVFIVLIIIMIGIIAIFKYNEYIHSNKYLLGEKGYSESEVETILKNEKMTEILLDRTYDENIIEVMSQKYYLEKHLDDYLNYIKKNKDTSIEDVIAIINVGSDKDWYDDSIETDLTKETLIIVNKFNYLDETYAIDDLVDMSVRYAFDGKKIKSEVYDAFRSMANAAKEDSLTLVANSTYRTYKYQQSLYNSYKNSKGKKYADSYAARPGYSEHQTGLAIDISTLKSTTDDFEDTKEFTWLKNNAHKYGFILRYPKNKEYLTGYNYESWHYRYVGIDVATKIKEENITFDEYYAYYLDK